MWTIIRISLLLLMTVSTHSWGSPLLSDPWRLDSGLEAKADSVCGLSVSGTTSASWNLVRSSVDKSQMSPVGLTKLVVPLNVSYISDNRYWPQLVVQVVGPKSRIVTFNGSQYSPYRRDSNPTQDLIAIVDVADGETINILVSKPASVPLSIAFCIGTPRLERIEVAREINGSGGLVPREWSGEAVSESQLGHLDGRFTRKFLDDTRASCMGSQVLPTLAEGIRFRSDLVEDASYIFAATKNGAYLRCVIETLGWMYSRWRDLRSPDLAHAHLLRALTLAEMWIGEDVNDQVKDDLKRNLKDLLSLIIRARSDPEQWWADEYASNYKHAFEGALGIACRRFVLSDYHECSQSVAEEMALVLQSLPQDGSSIEGPGYWNYSVVWIVGFIRSLDPDQQLRVSSQSAFLRNASRYRLHMSVPGFREVIPYGDTKPTEYDRAGTALRGLSSIQRDPIATDLAFRIANSRWPNIKLTWRDFAWTSDEPPGNSIRQEPTFTHLPDQGVLIWRSSWTEDDAEMVVFKAGPLQGRRLLDLGAVFGGHNHPDQGAVLFYSAGRWILSDDGYSSLKTTAQHNVVVLSGVGQIGSGGTWFDARAIQPETLPTLFVSTLSDGIVLAEGELQSAYGSDAKVAEWRRVVEKAKDGPLIVRDTIRLSGSGDVVWLFHSDQSAKWIKRGVCLGAGWLLIPPKALTTTDRRYVPLWKSDGSTVRANVDMPADIAITFESRIEHAADVCGIRLSATGINEYWQIRRRPANEVSRE